MNTATATRIAAGVTATYLRELTRRESPTCRPADRSSATYQDERPGSGGFQISHTTFRSAT